jgi:hypothetical protein
MKSNTHKQKNRLPGKRAGKETVEKNNCLVLATMPNADYTQPLTFMAIYD